MGFKNRENIFIMRRTVLYMAVSLDGFIADENGGIDWLNKYDGGEMYEEFLRTVDTVVMGRRTYNQIINELSPDKWVYEGLKSYVATKHPSGDKNGIEFTNDIFRLLKELKKEDGKDIWICGGAFTAEKLIKEGIIDRYHIIVIPILLGNGIRLFKKGMPVCELKLVSLKSQNGLCELIYDI